MNALTNYEQIYAELDEEEEINDKTTVGEVLAITFISFLTVVIFTVSSWSAISFLTGNTQDGGPIGLIMDMMRTTGFV